MKTAGPIEMVGGFETTYLPAHDRDVAETTEHDIRWRKDVALLERAGVTRLRYPVRWHRVESRQGEYDWRATDEVLGQLHDRGMRPIVDLVHHTSYPRWLGGGFGDAGFGGAYLRFAEAVARRYPWVREYTLFNEPFSTLFLAGHEAIWPPYLRGAEGFVELVANVLPAVSEASRMYRDLLPDGRHVYIDTCEHHYAGDAAATRYTAMANDRRFFVLDLLLGSTPADSGFLPLVLEAGGEGLLDIEPGHIDVLGLDYYAHCQWQFHGDGEGGVVPASAPIPLAAQIVEYWDRYGLPCMLSETNIRGFASDRATWLKYTVEQCELAVAAGVPFEGHCWFPFVDSADWDSLLSRCEGHVDPVGVHWLDEQLDRRASSMSRSYALAAAGVPAAGLPAYRLREPVATWLQGYLRHVQHWTWQPPPPDEVCSNTTPADGRIELRIVDGP
ncbi:MAG: family 1 glycosylhydrolase [Actinomycetota bacterium]|nr:family 1 glycosylhydrolase [Actinomycetota bacterium]